MLRLGKCSAKMQKKEITRVGRISLKAYHVKGQGLVCPLRSHEDLDSTTERILCVALASGESIESNGPICVPPLVAERGSSKPDNRMCRGSRFQYQCMELSHCRA